MWVEDSFKDIFVIQQSIEDKIITQKEINDINMEKVLLSIRNPQLKKDFEMVYNDLLLKLNSWEKEINIETKIELKILKDVVMKAGRNIAEQNSKSEKDIEEWNKVTIDAYTPFEREEGTPWYRNNNKTTGVQFSTTFNSSNSKNI